MEKLHGLTAAQVQERIEQGLVNTTYKGAERNEKQIIRDNLFTYFNFLNLALFLLVVLTGKIRNGLFIGTVVFNTCVGIFQEIRSYRQLKKMKILVASRVEVMRDGVWVAETADMLVRDDLIRVHTGMQVPADCVIEDGWIEVDESMLTGEADRIIRKEGEQIYCGTAVTSSSCLARIIKVGKQCTTARIIEDAGRLSRARSDLQESLDKMIRIISYVIIPFLILLFAVHVYRLDMSWQDGILKTAAAVIGMIPEGLVMLTSVALAVSAMRLSKRRVLVQDLFSIESLARVDTICLDKTGTLTTGSMSVRKVIQLDPDFPVNDWMSSYLHGSMDPNATQKALINFFGDKNVFSKTDELPFSSQRKYAAASFDCGSLYVGAYQFLFSGGSTLIDPVLKKHMYTGDRAIVAAYSSECTLKKDTLPDDLMPVAVFLISDDLRSNVQSIMQYLYQQDVDVRIISGDDPTTVSALAQKAGVLHADACVDLSTTDLDYDELTEKYTVFGRVLPDQKKKLVQALQKKGHTVAMTGDGVNDVPALKCADVSIAMASGTDAARDSSNVVLLDDDFGVIPDIVNEGRRVINNISRASSMYLVKTCFSVFLSLFVIIVGQPYPFLPIHLTLISALGVGIPTFLLQMEPSFERVRDHFFLESLWKALPSSVTVFICAMVTIAVRNRYGLGDEMFNGIFVLITSAVYLVTLWRVYQPVTPFRLIVIGAMGIGYIMACTFGKQVLYLAYSSHTVTGACLGIAGIPIILYIADRICARIRKHTGKE
ncbi:MAG: HAD-IC family P-type ATPase [Bulleidia sp.]